MAAMAHAGELWATVAFSSARASSWSNAVQGGKCCTVPPIVGLARHGPYGLKYAHGLAPWCEAESHEHCKRRAPGHRCPWETVMLLEDCAIFRLTERPSTRQVFYDVTRLWDAKEVPSRPPLGAVRGCSICRTLAHDPPPTLPATRQAPRRHPAPSCICNRCLTAAYSLNDESPGLLPVPFRLSHCGASSYLVLRSCCASMGSRLANLSDTCAYVNQGRSKPLSIPLFPPYPSILQAHSPMSRLMSHFTPPHAGPAQLCLLLRILRFARQTARVQCVRSHASSVACARFSQALILAESRSASAGDGWRCRDVTHIIEPSPSARACSLPSENAVFRGPPKP